MKTRHYASAVLVLAALLGAPALAAPQTYVIDDAHTFARFSYSHFGLSTQQSRFNSTSGAITFDKAARTASVEIEIDMTSVDTGDAEFNQHIQAEDFFHTARFPVATFKSSRVDFDGDVPVAVHGDLTIKGITRPVTLAITNFLNMPHPMVERDAVGADASVVVKRSDFDAGKYAPYVGDEVTISIALEAIVQ
jgi:polyisoprenoid-binding protein YceI